MGSKQQEQHAAHHLQHSSRCKNRDALQAEGYRLPTRASKSAGLGCSLCYTGAGLGPAGCALPPAERKGTPKTGKQAPMIWAASKKQLHALNSCHAQTNNPGPPTHPYKLLVDVLCQVLASQHSSAGAGCVPHDAADDDAHHIQLRSKPAHSMCQRQQQPPERNRLNAVYLQHGSKAQHSPVEDRQ